MPFRPVPEILALYRMRPGSLSMQTRIALADTLRVVERAYGADPRVVNPSPQHAGGVGPALCSRAMALGLHALSFAASEIGQGGPGLDLLLPLPDRRGDLVELCRQTIVSGVAFGAQCLEDELPADPHLAARVGALLTAVEGAATQPGLARQLGFLLSDLLRPRHAKNRTVAGDALLVRQELDRPTPILVSDRVDRVLVEFRHDGEVVARTEAPALGDLSAGDTMQLALDSAGIGPVMRAGAWLRRPTFWLAGARAGARLGADLVTGRLRRRTAAAPTARSLAKQVLGEAALAASGGPGAAGRTLDALIAEGQALAAHDVPPAPAGAAIPAAGIRPGADRPAAATTGRLPILAYRCVADGVADAGDGDHPTPADFDQHMQWLKCHGYRAVTSCDLRRHFAEHRPFTGRPVMIVFDEACADFGESVWPILRAHGFTAQLFVAADRLCSRGAAAQPADAMDWRQIQALAGEGVGFGSRLAGGRPSADAVQPRAGAGGSLLPGRAGTGPGPFLLLLLGRRQRGG